jgi:hypothetical protein
LGSPPGLRLPVVKVRVNGVTDSGLVLERVKVKGSLQIWSGIAGAKYPREPGFRLRSDASSIHLVILTTRQMRRLAFET